MKNVFWDFDGVILDSMAIRDWGFIEVFNEFDPQTVSKLVEYHRINGGLSRYVKIRYFFEVLLEKECTDNMINHYAEEFSKLMRAELIDPDNLIQDSLEFIKTNYKNYNFHIVSGSDQEELRFLCEKLSVDKFFISIYGSPIPKSELVQNLLKLHRYNRSETVLIGDSINDLEAAEKNNINFYGYNNQSLKSGKWGYINSFKEINIL